MAKKKPIPEDCMPRCGSCVFYQADPGDEAGYCRRFPPVVLPDEGGNSSAYPVVIPDDWCGEFTRKVN
ncbi:MAG: high-potential iron-sulfur protein [Bacillota bacterium]